MSSADRPVLRDVSEPDQLFAASAERRVLALVPGYG
jgi:hypothetical protein